MPSIKSAVVFQSVEAPQIEPMHQQAFLPYNNYDLVAGKPAGVLVTLDKSNIDRKQIFEIKLLTGSGKRIRHCFHEVSKDMIDGQQTVCFFTRKDPKNDSETKFFPLPMDEKPLNQGNYILSITITLYALGYNNRYAGCSKKKVFTVRTIKTGGLKLGFTRIYGGQNCKAYNIIREKTLKDFVNFFRRELECGFY
ncbi:MAG: hypothetical protein OXJ52_10115 [Oligoflexia bacterium]|nr:hypothetical protein [Oligoflexia bacterium]